MSKVNANLKNGLRLRTAFDDEVYGPIVEVSSRPNLGQFDFGFIARDVDLEANRICVLNTKDLAPEEANWLALCRPTRWISATLRSTPGGIFIVEGLRIAHKDGVRVKPEDMRLIFSRRAAQN
jgi:hypothetical protein